MLFPCLTTAALSFVASVHTPKPSVPRARVLATAELTELFPSGVHFAASAIPADFLPAGTAPTHKFSDTLMSAVGMYVLLNAGISFLPLIKRRITLSDGERERAQLEAIQASIQESSFGWHQADLRTPLPQYQDIDHHPIGIHNGRKVFLCRLESALHDANYHEIQYSKEFTEHYGSPVYVCFA